MGSSSYAVLPTDEADVRERLRALPGFAQPPLTYLLAFGTESGYPYIAKPIAACGSYGVSKVAGPEDVPGALARLGGRPFIMEEFLDGPGISVETFSFGVGFVHVGHTVPAALPETVADEVRALVERVEHSCGVDMESLTLAWALDLVEPLTEAPRPVHEATIRFLAAAPGEVVDVTGVDVAAGISGVRMVKVSVGPGDHVGPVEWSDDRPGHVIAVADRDAGKICARAADLIHIRTRPVPGREGSATLPACGVDQSALLGY